MLVEQGQTGEASAIVQHYAGVTATETKPTLNELFLRFDILSANFDSARRRLEALPEDEAHLAAAYEASIAFLTGDNEAALAGFQQRSETAPQVPWQTQGCV